MQQRTYKNKGRNIALEQVEGVLKNSPERFDAERGQGLATLSNIKRAKLVQSRRERARMEQRHGADHPRFQEADARMRREHVMLVNTRAERDRAGVPIVEREENQWIVHGHVRNQEGIPLDNANVALYPDRDGHRDALVQSKTDRHGYFKLNWSPEYRDTPSETGGGTGPGLIDEGGQSGLRINTNQSRLRNAAAAINNPVYLGASFQGSKSVDARTLYPTPGNVSYRDIELTVENTDACQLRTRYLGNSSTRELHDLHNEQPGCQIGRMRPDHRVYFTSEKQAQALGYDFCAYCYGPERSKR
ncbi:hypothetical protein GCM10007160_03890 [Litchfieldella qijiaojingensis]|uniref:Uncharacterized protein n=1 Tax=Litchfieldella qijiaojingensis TaxID=980347 RepID=A0ABQ2YDX7_9GAMM|nr:hypothetical protein [Halomonas qijiaojingensis]GGX79725.1 hypothetical protein GCM10007160_03890 [Halomonas qijiaojingensis]